FAAIEMLIRPDEHCLSTLWPATLTGSPAATAHWRATLNPWLPCWSAAPIIRSSTSPGSTRARLSASRIIGAAIDGDSISLNAPRYALPIGVRAVDTITASLIKNSLFSVRSHRDRGGRDY